MLSSHALLTVSVTKFTLRISNTGNTTNENTKPFDKHKAYGAIAATNCIAEVAPNNAHLGATPSLYVVRYWRSRGATTLPTCRFPFAVSQPVSLATVPTLSARFFTVCSARLSLACLYLLAWTATGSHGATNLFSAATTAECQKVNTPRVNRGRRGSD